MPRFHLRQMLGLGHATPRVLKRRVVPRLEALEDRWAPAVLHVGPTEQYKTIQSAVDASHNGDQVRIDAGTYQEQVTINTSILVQGAGPSTIILAPTNLGAPTAANPDAIVEVSATFATIANLTIEGASAGTANLLYGVRVDGGGSLALKNATVTNIIDASDPSLGVGIEIGSAGTSPDTSAQVGFGDIENDVISNYQRAGIVIANAGSVATVRNDTIAGGPASTASSVAGIEVVSGAVADIENNTITGNTNGSNGTGILIFNPGIQRQGDYDTSTADYLIVTVKNNKINGNDYGIFGSQTVASQSDQPASADIANNQIIGNTYVGIEFDNSANLSISGNQLVGNGSADTADGGIYLFQSTNNVLTNNTSKFNSNGAGIYVDGGSTGNTLVGNTAIGNSTANGNADVVDLSTGTLTAGTANGWYKTKATTYITNSNESLINNTAGPSSPVKATLKVGTNEKYQTIQAAIDAAIAGDTIQIDPGTYQEQLTITKSLTIEGTGTKTFIAAPSSLSASGTIVEVTSTFAKIENVTIEGAAAGTSGLVYGLRVDGGGSVQLLNSTVTNIIDSADPTLGVAIEIGSAGLGPDQSTGPQVGYGLIENSVISNYQRAGIVVANALTYAGIQSNTIAGGAASTAPSITGIEVSAGATALIASNTITGNTDGSDGAGIDLSGTGVQRLPDYDSDPNHFALVTVRNNVIRGNDYGIFGANEVATQADQLLSADIESNLISTNTYVGIEFDNSANVRINGNHTSDNGFDNTADGGIYLFQSTNNTLTNNLSNNNHGSGIYLDAGSTGNLVQNNNLVNNVFDTTAGNADAVDLSTGTGTAGTANIWKGNHGKTYIDTSGKKLF